MVLRSRNYNVVRARSRCHWRLFLRLQFRCRISQSPRASPTVKESIVEYRYVAVNGNHPVVLLSLAANSTLLTNMLPSNRRRRP